MAKYSKIPPVVPERLPSFTLKQLSDLNMFDRIERYRAMPITISQQNGIGTIASTINVAVSLFEGNSYVRLTYSIHGERMDYRLPLVKVKSNLKSGGWLWYAFCPVSNSRSRKLVLHGKYFVGIRSIKNRYYIKQVLSKRQRKEYNLVNRINNCDRIVKGRAKPYFKSHYKGMLTRPQIKVAKAREYLNRLSRVQQP